MPQGPRRAGHQCGWTQLLSHSPQKGHPQLRDPDLPFWMRSGNSCQGISVLRQMPEPKCKVEAIGPGKTNTH